MSQHFVIINNSKLLQSNISLFYGDIRYNISLLFIYFAHNSLHSLNRIPFLDPLPPLSPLVITSLFFTFVSVLSYMFIYFSGSTYRWEDLLLKLHILKLLKVFEASYFPAASISLQTACECSDQVSRRTSMTKLALAAKFPFLPFLNHDLVTWRCTNQIPPIFSCVLHPDP